MGKILLLATIISLLLFTSCFDTSEDSSIDEADFTVELTGDTIEVDTIVIDTGILTYKKPLVFAFDAFKDDRISYAFYSTGKTSRFIGYKAKIINPIDSTELNKNNGYAPIPETGTYNLIFEISPIDTSKLTSEEISKLLDFKDEIRVKLFRFKPIPKKYDGIWYKSYQAISVLELSKIDSFPTIEEALEVIKIDKDSFTKYRINRYRNTTKIDTMIYNTLEGDPFYSAHFDIEDGQLVSRTKGPNSQSKLIYSPVEQPLDSIKWTTKILNTTIPRHYHGTWYQSNRTYYEYEEYMEEKDVTNYTRDESNSYLRITSDSIIVYHFDGYEISEWGESIKERGFEDSFYFFTNGKIQYTEGEFDVGMIDYEEYTKFTGPCPPQKWIDDTTSN